MSQYPAITIPALLPLPSIPQDPRQYYEYFRSLHGVLSQMQSSTARAIDVLNFFRVTMPPPGQGFADLPSANNSGSLFVDSPTGRIYYDDKTTDPPSWQEAIPGAVKIFDEEPTGEDLRIGEVAFWYETPSVGLSLTDADIDLSGTHDGNLVGSVTVADAMDVLDDLSVSSGPIDDSDVDLSGTHTGLLTGDVTVADAMDVLDDISIELPTRQQVMNGSKSSVSDNTSTIVVTFTMPTGPSAFMAGLSFKGSSDDSTDAAAVWIQGVLKAVRVSGGTVTAEWVETINETFASGSETFGTCEVTVNVSSADVQVKIQLDSSLDQSWDVKWTALMSDDVTVAAA